MRTALGILCALALSAAAFEWAPAPLLGVAALWILLCGAAAARARSRSARLIGVYTGAALLTLAGFETYLLATRGSAPGHEFRGSYRDGGYFVDDAVLGYAPRPGITVNSTELVDGKPIYSVSYGIDEKGLRRVPQPTGRPSGSVVFFGCSVTFGEGLEDDETLPSLVAAALRDRYRVYNFGFHGYGPHQMLAAIESGRMEGIVEEPPVVVVYQALSHHIERAAGRTDWDRHGPRYRLREDGSVERAGFFNEERSPFASLAHRWLERALVYRQLFGSERPMRKEDLALMVGIVLAARDQIHASHPDARFEVLLWGRQEDGRSRKIDEALRQAGVSVHRVREILPGYEEDPVRYQLSPFDQHPNAAAQQILSRYVVESIVEAEGGGS